VEVACRYLEPELLNFGSFKRSALSLHFERSAHSARVNRSASVAPAPCPLNRACLSVSVVSLSKHTHLPFHIGTDGGTR
jgi:hypothetical protein